MEGRQRKRKASTASIIYKAVAAGDSRSIPHFEVKKNTINSMQNACPFFLVNLQQGEIFFPVFLNDPECHSAGSSDRYTTVQLQYVDIYLLL